jgi:uncharacterized protein
MKKLVSIPILLLLVVYCSKPKQKLTIMTGSSNGNYYKAAVELNEVAKKGNFELEIKESSGSNDNISELGAGKVQLALAQYDVILLNALYMGAERKAIVNKCFVVAPMSHEYIHIVVNNKSGIQSIGDLKDKKISVGPVNSGSWISAFIITRAFGNFDIANSQTAVNLSNDEAIKKLLAGELDAIFITSMLGMPALKAVSEDNSEKISLLSFGDKFEVPEGFQNIYGLLKVPAGTYPWQKSEMFTLGTFSYLLAFSDYDKKQIEAFSKTIYENADKLRSKSNLWEVVSKEYSQKEMKTGVPYHEGTSNYLKQ